MKPEQIKVGGFYVKKDEALVREILSMDQGKVQWLSYNLHDGSSWGDSSSCEIVSLASWAGREATPDEITRMKKDEARLHSQEREKRLFQQLARTVMDNISDEELLAEVRRRGYSLRK